MAFLALEEGNNSKKVYFKKYVDSKKIEELIPELKELNASAKNKYVFFSETKSNLTEHQVKNFKEAGFHLIQPGIENIQDDFLQAMNKGNRAIKHIELLKHCRTYCLRPVWNLLIGVPQEKQAWLEQITGIIPLITHLHPPMYNIIRIVYQKHSVYVNNPQAYGLCLQPAQAYSYLYPDKDVFAGLIEKTAYFFEPADKTEREGYYEALSLERYAALANQVKDWMGKFHKSGETMTMQVYEDKVEIIDLRAVSRKNLVTLLGVEKEIYLGAENAISKKDLVAKLKNRFAASQIEQSIEKLCQDKLLLEINGEILALATKKANYYYQPMEIFPLGRQKIEKT